jgi:hypothetical protein
MAKGVLIAFAHPQESAAEADFNAWYSNHHLPEILGIDGVVRATRYRAVDPAANYGYLAIYELNGDLEAILAEIHVQGPSRTPGRASRREPPTELRLFEFIEAQEGD